MSSSCLICSQKILGLGIFPGESLIYVENPKPIRFICQELSIDFEKIFSNLSLNIPFCTECHKLYMTINRIQIVLEQTKQQLDEVLSEIKDKVILSPGGTSSRDKSVADSDSPDPNKRLQVFRQEIARSTIGKQKPIAHECCPQPLPKPKCRVAVNQVGEKLKIQFQMIQNPTNEEDDASSNCMATVILPATSFGGQAEEEIVTSPTEIKSEPLETDPLADDNSSSSNESSDFCEPDNNMEESPHESSAEILYVCKIPGCQMQFPEDKLLKDHSLHFYHGEYEKKQYERKWRRYRYLCPICPKVFNEKESLKKHVRWHTYNIKHDHPVTCRFCNIKSVYPKKLRDHEIAKHAEKLEHSCTQCDQKYSLASILEAHEKTHVMEGPYICTYTMCEETTYEKAIELEEHIIRFHIPRNIKKSKLSDEQNSGNHSCSFCEKIYITSSKLAKHIRSRHSEKEMHTCELCPESYTTFPNFIRHMMKIHEVGSKQLSCRKCRKEFVTHFMLNRHLKGHELEARMPIVCEICDTRFTPRNEQGYNKHMETHSEQRKKKSHSHSCTASYCNKQFQIKVNCLVHERKHHPELFIYCCTVCDKAYSLQLHLDAHMKIHNDESESFDCSICVSKFSTSSALNLHLARHLGEETNQCSKPNCFATFRSKNLLLVHMIREHGEKRPFHCKIPGCGKGFIQMSALIKHKKTHEDRTDLPIPEKIPCQDCGVLCANKQSLSSHRIRMHHPVGSAIKMCEICGKSIKNYREHMRIHKRIKDHVCYFCEKRFVRRGALMSHILIHTAEKPYMCHICPSSFNQLHCLTTHHTQVHKKNGTWFPKPDSIDDHMDQSTTSGDVEMSSSPQVHPQVSFETLDFDVLMN